MAGGGSKGRRRAAAAILAGLVVVAPLAIGGVHLAVQAALQVATAIALALMLGDRRARGGRLAITVPAIALALALAATLLQLVPLPRGLLTVLSPQTAETVAATVGESGWRPLTLDVAATVAEAGKLSLYLAFFVAATLYATRSSRRRILLLAVVGAAVACAGIGFLQAIAGSTNVLFVYSPESQILNEILVRGTFVNPNHFGALLALAAPIALVWGMREPHTRWIAFGSLIILDVGVVLSLSRGAMVAAFVGQALAFALDRSQESLRAPGRKLRLAILVGVGLVAVAVGAVALRAVLERSHPGQDGSLLDTSSKTYVWRHALEVAWHHPWTGVGRGAFEQAFTRSTTLGGTVRHQFAENGYLQAMVDWGVPITLLLGLLALLAARLSFERLGRDPLAIGALGGLAALAVHELADFSIELPGVALPALAMLATLFGSRASEEFRAQKRVPITWVWVVTPILPLVIGALVFAFPSAGADASRLRELAADPAIDVETFIAKAEAARARHPGDYTIPAVVASHLAARHHPATLRWLNDVIFLNPSHQGAHLLAAEVLASAGHRDQALVEYRSAAAAAAPSPAPIWERAGRRFSQVEDLLRAVPPTANDHLYLVEWLWSQARWRDASTVLARARTLAPDDTRILRRQVEVAIRGSLPEATTLARELLVRQPDDEVRLLVAEAAVTEGSFEEAGKLLDSLSARTVRRLDVELHLVEAMLLKDNIDAARRRLNALDWSSQRLDRARVHQTRADLERRAGNDHQSRWELEQATRLRSQ